RAGGRLIDDLRDGCRAAGGEIRIPAVAGREGMAADRQACGAEGGGGHVARGTDVYRTAGVGGVDLEVVHPGLRDGDGLVDADVGGEGERLPEYGRVGRRDQHRAGAGLVDGLATR